jgi:flagellar FliJ protein
MNALQPLITLLAQTERERDESVADAQRAEQAWAAAAAQAQQLVGYRSEYEQRWSAQFKLEGKMELVNCYRGFMDRLSLAVDQQARAVRQAEAHVERLKVVVRENEVRVASVRKLIERRIKEVQQSADRVEQKQTDEFASRAAWGRRNSGHSRLGALR